MPRSRLDIRTNRLFSLLLKATLGSFLRLQFNVRTRNRGLLRRLKPPYLVLPNHVGYWDPFILGSIIPHPVCFLAADANFRSRILAPLLALAGTIPKSKGISDLGAIRGMLRIRDRGDIICLFAEGERTWDGGPLPLFPATAKLVRLLGIPVLTPVFHGGHLSHPRWARFPRRGRLLVDFRLALNADETRSLPLADIAQRLEKAIAHDDWEEQKRLRLPYRGRRRAEYAEHVLHVCPNCGGVATMRSRGNRVSCRRCGYTVACDEQSFFRLERPRRTSLRRLPARQTGTAVDEPWPEPPLTVGDWSRMQKPLLDRWLEERRPDIPVLGPVAIRGGVGYRRRVLQPLPPSRMVLWTDRLELTGPAPRTFPLGEIEGLNVQHLSYLEFYHSGRLYSLHPQNRRVPVHLWRTAIQRLRRSPSAELAQDSRCRHSSG